MLIGIKLQVRGLQACDLSMCIFLNVVFLKNHKIKGKQHGKKLVTYSKDQRSINLLIKGYELPDVQAGFRKGRGTRDQSANIHWIIKKAREFQKNIYFCLIDYAKAVDCVDQNKLWKILKEMGIPDHLTCLLRNLYEGQETIRTGHRTTD